MAEVISKQARHIVPNDVIYLDDGRTVKVAAVGKGLWPGSVLIDFFQPKDGGRVHPTFSCVAKNTMISVKKLD